MGLFHAYTTVTDDRGRKRQHLLYAFTAPDKQAARARAEGPLREWPGCYGEVWEITGTTADGRPAGHLAARTTDVPRADWAVLRDLRACAERECQRRHPAPWTRERDGGERDA